MASIPPDPFLAAAPSSSSPSPSPAATTTTTAASTSSPSKPKLTLDDITRLFSVPITDAANLLGVSTSVLKRLCRKNGIARWPYRQLLSGKSLDDIKKEAEIEKSKLQKHEETGKKKTDSKANAAGSTGSSKNTGDQNKKTVPGQALQQGNKFMTPHLDPFSQMKNVPTYLDEFKCGFPSNGLSSATNKWWGGEGSSPEQPSIDKKETQKKPCETLVALRTRAVEESRNLIEGKKGTENCKLNKKQKLVLMQVFGSSLPDQWKTVVS